MSILLLITMIISSYFNFSIFKGGLKLAIYNLRLGHGSRGHIFYHNKTHCFASSRIFLHKMESLGVKKVLHDTNDGMISDIGLSV